MLARRSKQSAVLLPDGSVLLWGGLGVSGTPVSYGEIFDPATQSVRIQALPISPSNDPQLPRFEETRPEDETTGAAVAAIVAVRFSNPLNVHTGRTATMRSSNSQVS